MRNNAAKLAVLATTLLVLLWWFNPAEIGVPLCLFHAMTGLKCPGCGVMRATHELLHLRLGAAWRQNALWVLSLPLVAYLVVSELRVCSGGSPLPGNLPRRRWFWLSAIAVAMVFFVVRNVP
jgi:uncharacterized membrane protein YhdT